MESVKKPSNWLAASSSRKLCTLHLSFQLNSLVLLVYQRLDDALCVTTTAARGLCGQVHGQNSKLPRVDL